MWGFTERPRPPQRLPSTRGSLTLDFTQTKSRQIIRDSVNTRYKSRTCKQLILSESAFPICVIWLVRDSICTMDALPPSDLKATNIFFSMGGGIRTHNVSNVVDFKSTLFRQFQHAHLLYVILIKHVNKKSVDFATGANFSLYYWYMKSVVSSFIRGD